LRTDPYADKTLEYRPQGFDLPLLRRARNREIHKSELSRATIPAQTPLLWSVGISNCEPREGLFTLVSDDQIELSMAEEDEKESIEVIRLEGTVVFYWRSPIIFTLPKIKPTEDSPANNQPKENDANKIEE